MTGTPDAQPCQPHLERLSEPNPVELQLDLSSSFDGWRGSVMRKMIKAHASGGADRPMHRLKHSENFQLDPLFRNVSVKSVALRVRLVLEADYYWVTLVSNFINVAHSSRHS